MLKIGITGGIGSGKSTVCKLFELHGVPVYYADERAKQITSENEELKSKIIAHFGNEAYLPDGSYNRTYIAGIVFNDQAQLNLLNSIIHPAVRQDAQIWNQKHIKYPYTLKEAALLFEAGSYRDLDNIIFVDAPQDIRIERVMLRDGLSKEAVLARIHKQMPDTEKRSKSDFIILNDGTTSLIRQVHRLHRSFLALSGWKQSHLTK